MKPIHIETNSSGFQACDVTVEALASDPYPIFDQLRVEAPVVWAPALDMWLVTGYDDVRSILLDNVNFVTGSTASLILNTFGENMLTVDGDTHVTYRPPSLTGAFMPNAVRARFQMSVEKRVGALIDSFANDRHGDLRSLFASRLPVQVMLDVFGLPEDDESIFRAWYNAFEAALSNHAHDPDVAAKAKNAVSAFHCYLQSVIDSTRKTPNDSLLNDFLNQPKKALLHDDQIRRNALIIFFGGISTVEAIILNTLWALFNHPESLKQALSSSELTTAAIVETMRWISPVQSATRHTAFAVTVGKTTLPPGETVNCMLGSANRDERIFENASRFQLGRANANKHLGFAVGPHLCLGRHLALMEARIAITQLFSRLQALRLTEQTLLRGHEFRQPEALHAAWG